MVPVIQVKIVLTLVAGIYCDEIELHTSKIMSPCPRKPRHGFDSFYLTGEIKGYIPSYLRLAEPTVNVTVLRHTTMVPLTACSFLLTAHTCVGVSCNGTYTCTCVFIDQRRVSFMANLTLQAIDSNALIRVAWHRRGGIGTVLSSEYRTIPEVRDLQNITLVLTFAGATENVLRSRFCIFDTTLHPHTILELCCFETSMPCHPQISFRGLVVANNDTPCVTYSVPGQTATGMLILSFSLCTRSDYVVGSDCIHRRGTVITRAKTMITSTVITRATTTTTTTTHMIFGRAITTTTTTSTVTTSSMITTTTTTNEITREIGVLTPSIDEVTESIGSMTAGMDTTHQQVYEAVSTDVSIKAYELQKYTMKDTLEILIWSVMTISMFIIIIVICTYAIIVGSQGERASASDFHIEDNFSVAKEEDTRVNM